MENNTENPKNMSLLKNVYDTRKKKIRKKLSEHRRVNYDDNNHHVLNNNNSSNLLRNASSENLLECNNDNVNRCSSSCYIKRRRFPLLLLFLFFYTYSYCHFCCSLSSFGVVVLANDEIIDNSLNRSKNSTYLSFDRTTTTGTTMTTPSPHNAAVVVRETRDIRAERLHDLALNDEEYDEDEEEEPDEDYDITRNKSGKLSCFI